MFDDWLPDALSIGVDYNLFWHLTPRKLEAFTKAYKLKVEREQQIIDLNNWYLGQYVMDALFSTVCNHGFWLGKNGKPHKYPQKPYYQKEEKRNKEEKDLEANERLAVAEMLKFSNVLKSKGMKEAF